MELLKKVNAISPEVSWKEFGLKFIIMFLFLVPVPTIGLALAGYFGASAIGFSRGIVPAIAVLGGALIGAVIGLFMTLVMIRVGHKD